MWYRKLNGLSGSIRLTILGPGFNTYQSFGHWLTFLDNLPHLTNLLRHNLEKKHHESL